MPKTVKEAMIARDSQRGEYHFFRKKTNRNMTKRESPVVVGGPTKNLRSVREKRNTQPFDLEELAQLRSLPKVTVSKEAGTTFNLTKDEILFIQECADKWNLPYEIAVAKVIHNALDCLKNVSLITEKYGEKR